MSIKINHVTQEISVTGSEPLVLNAPSGIKILSPSPKTVEGTLAYDYATHVLKYRNNTEWVILGSANDYGDKARKLFATDFGTGTIATGRYLSAIGAVPTWIDPTTDGFIRFNAAAVTLSPAMTFNGAVVFNQSVNCTGNIVRNIITGTAVDAVPRSYVDAAISTASNAVVTDLNIAYAALIKKYQDLISEIYNEPFPPKPTVDTPIVIPPIVIPPIIVPPNPPKRFDMNYADRTLGTAEQATVLASWAQLTATTMNGLNGQPRVPASGSTFYVTFKQKYSFATGTKAGTVLIDKARYVLFNWTGSSAGIIEVGDL